MKIIIKISRKPSSDDEYELNDDDNSNFSDLDLLKKSENGAGDSQYSLNIDKLTQFLGPDLEEKYKDIEINITEYEMEKDELESGSIPEEYLDKMNDIKDELMAYDVLKEVTCEDGTKQLHFDIDQADDIFGTDIREKLDEFEEKSRHIIH